jgi:tetratricopeptide (TPR) repeat protein
MRYLKRDKATRHKVSLKVGAIFALVIALEFLILGAGSRAAERPIRIAADKLMAEYQNNQIAANARYKDKSLAVTGIVANVGKDIGDTVYVTLETGVMVFKIQCFFKKGGDTALAQIVSGVQLTVIGRCDGKVEEGNILLKECALKGQLKKTQELAEAYWGRGNTYHELGDYQQAIKDFDRAIELDPRFAEAYRCRGKTYNELGNRQQAIEDWKAAAKSGDEEAQDILRSKKIKW